MAKKTPGLTVAAPIKNRVQKFEYATIARSDISEAPYNPRFIDAVSAEKLEAALVDADIGLVEPLVWNKRTGNLVGGHQRIGQMDAIHEGENYEVPVAVIDVDETTERKINIMLNNTSIMGSFDIPKLEQLFRDEGISPFEVGFETIDLTNMFPTEVVFEFIDKYLTDEDTTAAALPGETDTETLGNTADEIAEIKDARKKHKEADGEALRADHHFTVVFHTVADCQRAQAMLRLPPDDQFFMADRFFEAVQKYGANYFASVGAMVSTVAPPPTDAERAAPLALAHDGES